MHIFHVKQHEVEEDVVKLLGQSMAHGVRLSAVNCPLTQEQECTAYFKLPNGSNLPQRYSSFVANGVHSEAKIPLHDVDTGVGRRFGARQLWRAKRVSGKSAPSVSAGFRLDEPGHILASAALVTPWSNIRHACKLRGEIGRIIFAFRAHGALLRAFAEFRAVRAVNDRG